MIVLKRFQEGDGHFYRLAGVVIMPDHVHAILRPLDGYSLSRILKGVKGTSARLINQHRGIQGTLWQDESWDRIVRDEAEFREKMLYLAHNPVKAGLVGCIDDYPYCYFSPEIN
ncbi:transposase [Rubinisphaera sp. ICM_H10]|uniref:REP-associated tyrosine transposase n=1 Tax=Rubinisphaera margarita TaxID=2909586 RepID=UPI001EE864CD|nr:transposase [Rubinisphaera margarita]